MAGSGLGRAQPFAPLQQKGFACENALVNPLLISGPAAIFATAGVAAYGAVYPRSQLFGSTICRTNSPGRLAITFDDGPNPRITAKLLDLLDRHQARATFFLIGKFVRECPEIVRETAARGHVLANHTHSHPNLFWLSAAKIEDEFRLCSDAISSVTGARPKWFRPPFGFRNPWVVPGAEQLGLRTVMWTRIPGDWQGRPADGLIPRMASIAEHAREHATASRTGSSGARVTGDILCLHDGGHRELNADRTPTLGALEHWLPRWRDLGLEFVTIEEAVRTPAT
jgi:peptidoglycan/xylan/chitin deacetylase (PgdA/CDA1 family)